MLPIMGKESGDMPKSTGQRRRVVGEAKTAEEFAAVTIRVARAAGFTDHEIAVLFTLPDEAADAAFDLAQIRERGCLLFSAADVKTHMAAMVVGTAVH